MTPHLRGCAARACRDCDIPDLCPNSEWNPPHPAHHSRPRVYVAGPLNAEDAPGYIRNVHRFVAVSRQLRRLGFSPFNPALDLIEGIAAGDFTYEDYFDANLAWVEVSDVLYLIDHSPGADREVARAETLGIGVVESIAQLLEWREHRQPDSP